MARTETPLIATNSNEKVSFFCSIRFSLAILSSLGMIIHYMQRLGINMAVVNMVHENPYSSVRRNISEKSSLQIEKFYWNKQTQGKVLGSYYWGYITCQIFGGWMADKFGGKWVFGIANVIASLCSLITPAAATRSVYLLIILRVLQGICQSVCLPAMFSIWANWAPLGEKSRLKGIVSIGSPIGKTLSMLLTGLICNSYGWPKAFYVYGLLGILWFIVWMVFTSNSPAGSYFISTEERLYIEDNNGSSNTENVEIFQVPWMKILCSGAVWANIICMICGHFIFFTMEIYIPSYMNDILKFDIKENALLSSIPFFLTIFFILLGSFLADKMISKGLSITFVRKFCNSLGFLLPMIFFAIVGYITIEHKVIAVAVLSVALALTGFFYSGFRINSLDIAPQYSGTIYGITNTLGCLSGIFGPIIVSIITEDKMHDEWQLVFWIIVIVCFIGFLTFLILGKGEVLEWAKYEETEGEIPGPHVNVF